MNSVKCLFIFALPLVNSFKILPRIQNVTKTVGLLFPQVTVSKFPPLFEPVVQRIQASQSNYIYADQSRPVPNYTLSPEDEIYFGIASTTQPTDLIILSDEEVTNDMMELEYVDILSSTEKLFEKFQSDIGPSQNETIIEDQSISTNTDNLDQLFSNTEEDLDTVNCEWSESVVNTDGSEISSEQTDKIDLQTDTLENAEHFNLLEEPTDTIQNSGVDYGLANVVHKNAIKENYEPEQNMDQDKRKIENEEQFNEINQNNNVSIVDEQNKIAKNIEDSAEFNETFYYGAARPNKNVPYSEILDVVIDESNESVIVGDVSELLSSLTTKEPSTPEPQVEETTNTDNVEEISSLPNLIIPNSDKPDGNYGLPNIIYVKNWFNIKQETRS